MLLKNDIKRMLRSPKIYLAFLISFFILIRPLLGAFFEYSEGTLAQFMSVPFGMSDFSPFAALFCALPFADSFCEDFDSGFFRLVAGRIGARRYSLQRCVSVALSGGVLMAAVVLLTILVCVLLANRPETEETARFMHKSIWARMDLILRFKGVFLLALKVVIAFLFGCLWALVALLVSAFITNRYVTFIVPFAVYQLSWFLLRGRAFNPVYMFRGDADAIPSIWFILIYQSALILICSALAFYKIRRKVAL